MGIVLLACLAITQILYKEINCPREKEMCCRATTSANQGTIDTISECVIGVKSFCKNLFIEWKGDIAMLHFNLLLLCWKNTRYSLSDLDSPVFLESDFMLI